MSSRPPLALLGAAPAFDTPLPVGQLNFPDWNSYVEAMRSIFERQYYTNHGPLVQALESTLQERLGVRHVIAVTNATIGLIMAAEALQLHGKVITPAFSFVATAQSLSWAGLEPLFCDVDRDSQHLCPKAVEAALEEPEVSAILAVNLWGDFADVPRLRALAQRRGIPLYLDSAHAFGCVSEEGPAGTLGEVEVFSFHATKVLGATEGGCICTSDDTLAARLRNIRSSYGAGPPVPVARTANGRMSEAQAAIALLELDRFPALVERNRKLFSTYKAGLEDLPGLHLRMPQRAIETNYQYVVCEIDASTFGFDRDALQTVLRAENVLARRYFYPGIHRVHPYCDMMLPPDGLPHTDALCTRLLQLPLGQRVDISDAKLICDLIHRARTHSGAVLKALETRR